MWRVSGQIAVAVAAAVVAVGESAGCTGDRGGPGATAGYGDGGIGERVAEKPVTCGQQDLTCDGIDDDCDGRTDDDFIPRGDVIKCVGGRQCRATDATCDGVDDDCDGRTDDDYPARVPTCPDGCPAARTTCSGGIEAVPCQPCVRWPAVAGGWMFFLNAYDFDVAAGKMCLVPLVPTAGPVGGIACTTTAGGNSSRFTVLETPAGFTDGCDTIKCGNRVALDAAGGIWAARPGGVYRATDAGSLVRIADKPPSCATAITAIEIAGDALGPRLLVICGPAGGSVASVGTVHELDLSQTLWLDHNFKAATFGASPSRGFDLFLGIPPESGSAEMYFARFDMIRGVPLPIGRIGSGSAGKVGGIYMSASGPFAGGFTQWTGKEIAPVSDFTAPLAVENAYLGRFARLAAAGTGRPAALPYKVVEGGGDAIGGPSPDGQVDVLWILNETLRVESYNLGPIPDGVAGPLDYGPVTR